MKRLTTTNQDFDVAIIGSGFGGSVAALRLTQKGYRVVVIEAGADPRRASYAVGW